MSESRTTPMAVGQETIQMLGADYLGDLRRLVRDGRARNDPTLAVALSIEALGELVDEVDAARRKAQAEEGRP